MVVTPTTDSASNRVKRFAAFHVGRFGEVAGGMTQVINGYLAWDFDRFESRVIRSRDGRRGVPAVLLFVRATLDMLRLRNDRRSVIVTHLSQGGSFVREGFLLWLACRRGFPTVAQLHGSSFVGFARRRPGLVRSVLSKADVVHALSVESIEAVRQLLPDAPTVLIPNAVAPGRATAKEPLVVFGGSVSRRKGVDVLLAAWSNVVESHADWTLVIAGPLAEPDIAQSLPPNAELLGSIPHDLLLGLLDRSSIAVLPSLDEAMPMFILEALARDNCVISTPVGGIPRLLADGRGVLVEVGSTRALEDALERAMVDPAWAADAARKGRAAFDQEFSSDIVMPQLESMWAEVIVGGRTAAGVLA